MAITAAVQTIGWLLGSMVLAAGQPATAPAATPSASGQAATAAPAAPAVETVAARLPVRPPAATPSIVDRAQAEAAGMTIYWQRGIPLKGERLRRIDRIDENLYLMSDENRVVVLDAATGVYRWSAKLAEEGIRLLGPTHGTDQVYFAGVLGIQGFDRTTGDRRINWNGPVTASSPIATDGQQLYFGTIDGRVVALRLSGMLATWQFATHGLVTAAPILVGPNLYAVSQAGDIYAAQKRDKVRLWETRTTGPVRGDPATWGSHLYVASMDQSLWCFDMVTGRTLWRSRMSFPLEEGPVATAKHVYLPVRQHGVFSINPDDGQVAWNREDAMIFLAETDRYAWLASQRSSLLACDKAGGEVRREVSSSADLFTTNEDDDAIWMATTDGQVACVRPIGAGFLRYRKAYEAIGRATLPTTQPSSQPASEDFVPTPPPKAPVDTLRRNDAIPPVGGSSVPATQPAGGQ